MASIVFTSTDGSDIDPKFTFSSPDVNITYQVSGGGESGSFVSGVEHAAITIANGATITYTTDGDWSGVTAVSMNGDAVSGSISQFTPFTSLTYLSLHNTSVEGNISALAGMTELIYLHMSYTSVEGNISALAGMTELTYLHMYNTSVSANANCLDTQRLMTNFQAQDCGWTDAEVDNCLASLVVNEAAGDSGRDCAVTIDGTNDAPSQDGATDAFMLVEADWTVDINVDAGSQVGITEESQLAFINTDTETLGWNYILLNDITMTSPHTPIGDGTTNMTGDWDGNGFKIIDMVVSATVGFMGFIGVTTGSIADMGIVNGTASTSDDTPGGIGLLAGQTLGTVDRCYSTGSVSSTGGTGPDAGGLIGILGGASAIITDCYSWASVVANDAFGGGLIGDSSAGSVVTCYSIGAVSGTGTLGGLLGDGGVVTSSFYNSDTSGRSDDDGRGEPLTTSQMQQPSSFTDRPELVVNGGFDTDITEWSNPTPTRGNIAWDDGRIKVTNNEVDSYPYGTQAINTVIGVAYRITSDVGIGTATLVQVRVASATYTQDFTDDGRADFEFVAEGAHSSVLLYVFEAGNTGHYAFFDNVSVKELPFDFATNWAMIRWGRRSNGRLNPFGTSRYNRVDYPRLRSGEAFGGRV